MCRFACLFQVEVWRSSDVVALWFILLLCDRNQESQLKVCAWTCVCVCENSYIANLIRKCSRCRNSMTNSIDCGAKFSFSTFKKIYSIYTVNFIAVKTIYIIQIRRTNHSKCIRSIPFYSVQIEKEKWNENEEWQCSISIVRHQSRNFQLFTRTNIIRKMPKEAS